MTSTCPICDGSISIPQGTVISELLHCSECQSSLIVQSISAKKATLAQAPTVEEDWGQ